MLHFNLALLPHLFYFIVSGSFVSPYFLLHPHPQRFVVEALLFHLLYRCEAPPTLASTNLPPSILRRWSLHLTPCACICHCYRASAITPLSLLSYTQVLVSPWGVISSRVPPRLCVPALPFLSSPLNLGIVRSLVLLLGVFLRKGERLGRLHSLAVVRPGTRSP